MKKVLFATTALVLSGGMAMADVTLGGSGRFGLVYLDTPAGDDTVLSYRMRVNIDASKETDAGVVFGGRIRLQYDAGDTVEGIADDPLTVVDESLFGQGAAELNAAMLYAESSGFRVEVGNVNTALDSMSTLYNAEIGFISSTFGSYSPFRYDSYSSGPYAAGQANRVGIFASYTAGDFVGRVSYIDYDQTDDAANTLAPTEDEISISIDYSFGAFKVGAGYNADSAGVDGYDVYALTGEFALSDTTNVGLQLIGEDGDPVDLSDDTTLTLYGNTQLAGGVTVKGYLSGIDTDLVTDDDYAVGIGASYDLGGATIDGSVQRGFFDETYVDLGVNFSF